MQSTKERASWHDYWTIVPLRFAGKPTHMLYEKQCFDPTPGMRFHSNETSATIIPNGVSFDQAAFTTLGAIAMQGVRQADARIGENVAVIGLGLIGLLTVQLLKAAGGYQYDHHRYAPWKSRGPRLPFT
jgi:hypothetical protein